MSLLSSMLLTSSAAPVTINGIISNFAGTGATGSTGNGGQATAAKLYYPYGIAFDGSGNAYIADNFNHLIRKVTPGGIISTFAGTGVAGFTGDSGLATSAKLDSPGGVSVDASGNVYIADSGNNRIRKVTTGGIISTFAGTGAVGSTGDGGQATAAEISYPSGIAFDAFGNSYISDSDNSLVRKVTTSGIISTFAGTGAAGSTGDGGQATSAEIDSAAGIAVDSSGNVYFADNYSNRVRKVTTGGIISTFAGTGATGSTGDGGQATAAEINRPYGIAFDASGNMYIADSGNNRIRKVTTGGIISTFAGTGAVGSTGDGGLATSAKLNSPCGVSVDASGNVYIADTLNNRIRKVS